MAAGLARTAPQGCVEDVRKPPMVVSVSRQIVSVAAGRMEP
jgi:hypothetical protein